MADVLRAVAFIKSYFVKKRLVLFGKLCRGVVSEIQDFDNSPKGG